MRIRDLIRAIIEDTATGGVKPIGSSSPRRDADAYQTRQPQPKAKSRWQTPPAPPKPPKPPTTP